MMTIHIINQEPIEVSDEVGKTATEAIKAGAEYITVNGEYIRATSISSIRSTGQSDKYVLWGSSSPTQRLAEHAKKTYTGEGLKKFQETRRKLGL